MRTFIAIELSHEFKQALADLQNALRRSDADVKWVEPDNIHLTLKFLGEVAEEFAGGVKGTLDTAVTGSTPFEMNLSGIGVFPKLTFPRIVWVGIDDGIEETRKIAEKLDEELFKLGFAKEEREFTAHLTIGRVRSAKNKQALKDAIESLSSQPSTINSQRVTAINLYQSTLTPQGPIYTCLHTAAFHR